MKNNVTVIVAVLLSLFCGALVILPVRALSEGPDLEWSKTFGGTNHDVGFSVQQTSDGGYIIIGMTKSFSGDKNDVFLVKTDSNGNQLWNRTFGGWTSSVGYSVQQTSDGGYILAGMTAANYLENKFDVFLVKTDSNGNQLWNRTFGGSKVDCGYCVQQTGDGGYIVVGVTNSFGHGGDDIYLIKTDSEGNKLWGMVSGGPGDDIGRYVQQTSEGGFIIVGTSDSFNEGGKNELYLAKWDSNGAIIWDKTFGGTGNYTGTSVQQTSDGGYIAVGHTGVLMRATGDAFLVKTDSNGNQLWNRTFGGLGSDFAYSVQQTSDGGYILAGMTSANYLENKFDVFLVKTDSNGNQLWNRTFGGSDWDWVNSVQQTTDGGFITVGWTGSFGAGGDDVYLLKFAAVKRELMVLSDYGDTSGEGTYDEGTMAPFSVSPNIIEAETGVRYVFSGWGSDSPGGYTGPGNSAEVLMNSDITESARWATQYYLSVHAGTGGSVSPSSGWFEAGSEVTITAVPLPGYAFSSWNGSGAGSYTGSDSTHQITVNKPLTETAIFISTTGTIKIALEDPDHKPLSGVAVKSTSQPDGQEALSETTGTDGTLTFSDAKPGSYEFETTKQGFASKTNIVTVQAGEVSEEMITLERIPAEASEGESGGGGIPGFPHGSIILGLAIAAIILWLSQHSH